MIVLDLLVILFGIFNLEKEFHLHTCAIGVLQITLMAFGPKYTLALSIFVGVYFHFVILLFLQTFSQLCTYDYETKSIHIYKAPWYVRDRPRFAFRGLLLGMQVFC